MIYEPFIFKNKSYIEFMTNVDKECEKYKKDIESNEINIKEAKNTEFKNEPEVTYLGTILLY